MRLFLASPVRTLLLDAAAAAHPHEACGLLFGRAGVDGLHVTSASIAENVAADPARAFEVAPAHLFAVQRAAREGGPVPVGVWHSHPAGPARPSEADRGGISDPAWAWLILAGDRLAAWLPDPAAPGGFASLAVLDLPVALG